MLAVTLRSTAEDSEIPLRTITLKPNVAIPIGRASTNMHKNLQAAEDNAYIDSPVISRSHAVITANSTCGVRYTPYHADTALADPDIQIPSVYIRDIGSMHGTMVNGSRLTPHRDHLMKNGDVLQLGCAVFRENGTSNSLPRNLSSLASFATTTYSYSPVEKFDPQTFVFEAKSQPIQSPPPVKRTARIYSVPYYESSDDEYGGYISDEGLSVDHSHTSAMTNSSPNVKNVKQQPSGSSPNSNPQYFRRTHTYIDLPGSEANPLDIADDVEVVPDSVIAPDRDNSSGSSAPTSQNSELKNTEEQERIAPPESSSHSQDEIDGDGEDAYSVYSEDYDELHYHMRRLSPTYRLPASVGNIELESLYSESAMSVSGASDRSGISDRSDASDISQGSQYGSGSSREASPSDSEAPQAETNGSDRTELPKESTDLPTGQLHDSQYEARAFQYGEFPIDVSGDDFGFYDAFDDDEDVSDQQIPEQPKSPARNHKATEELLEPEQKLHHSEKATERSCATHEIGFPPNILPKPSQTAKTTVENPSTIRAIPMSVQNLITSTMEPLHRKVTAEHDGQPVRTPGSRWDQMPVAPPPDLFDWPPAVSPRAFPPAFRGVQFAPLWPNASSFKSPYDFPKETQFDFTYQTARPTPSFGPASQGHHSSTATSRPFDSAQRMDSFLDVVAIEDKLGATANILKPQHSGTTTTSTEQIQQAIAAERAETSKDQKAKTGISITEILDKAPSEGAEIPATGMKRKASHISKGEENSLPSPPLSIRQPSDADVIPMESGKIPSSTSQVKESEASPRKKAKVKSSNKLKYAATAITGFIVGAAGMFATLAALPESALA